MTQTAEDNPGRAKIHQLLTAIGSRGRDDGKQVEAVDYDWHQPHFFNSQQTKKLAGFAAESAVLIAEKFGALCQHAFEVKITSTSEHFAGQFLGQDHSGQTKCAACLTAEPANYYLPFRTGQDPPCGFISISPQTAVIWATQLLGDTAKENSIRPLSDLEASFLFDMTLRIIEAISEAGEKCRFSSAAEAMTNVLPLQLKGTEEFCKITFDVKKAASESAAPGRDAAQANKPGSEAHILILCEKLAPAIGEAEQLAGKFSGEAIALAMQNHIEKIPVPVTLQLACVPITVEQMLNLAVGDVLVLDKKINEPAQLLAAGKTVCRGFCAKSANNYAMVVTETVCETT
jgi:flagellar motor switch/type III secretory pathway protein FliN